MDAIIPEVVWDDWKTPGKMHQHIWHASLICIVFSLAFLIYSITIVNIDLWGHLKFGLVNLANRSIAQEDSFSYLTSGARWYNHEWMAQIIFAISWLVGKTFGLVILKILLGFTIIAIFYRNQVHRNIALLAGSLVILSGILVLSVDFTTLYPQVFSLLGFTIILWILGRSEEGYLAWLWMTPLLFLAAANLHGGFLLILVIYSIWIFLYLIQHPQKWRSILPPFLFAWLVTGINPYGFSLYGHLFKSVLDLRPEIDVWGPIPILSLPGLLFLTLLGASILGFIYSRKEKSMRLVVIFSILALSPVISRRHLPYFAIAAVMIAGEHLADVIMRWNPLENLSKQPPKWLPWVLIFMAGTFSFAAISNLSKIRLIESPPYPVQAVELIKQSGVKGNLAIEYNWGGYAIWHLWPKVQVSVDGRRETVYSRETYEISLGFLLALEQWDRLLTDYPTDLVLVNNHTPVFNLMRYQPDWRLVFEDESSALYVRRGSAIETPLVNTAQSFVLVDDKALFP